MDRRFSLLLVGIFLFGGAIVLWLNSPQPAIAPPASTAIENAPTPNGADQGTFGLYTLAVSWQPAFCETEPRKPECRSMVDTRYDADHFTLHGLWPQDSYCGVSQRLIDADKSGAWDALPAINLSAAIRTALERVMPGTQSGLERHEWLVHGTCSGVSMEAYFQRAITFVEALNSSELREVFSNNIGRRVNATNIRAAFNSAFGRDASTRLRIDCADDGNRELIVELRIRLYGDVMSATPIAQLINRATPGRDGCASGIVDRVGDQ